MRLHRHTTTLFRSACAFNVLGAALILLMPESVETALRMPAGAASGLYGQCTIGFILLFAGMYWLVSKDPRTYHPYIAAGIVGKLTVVTLVLLNWLHGDIGPALPIMVTGDIAFAVAFWRYLGKVRLQSLEGFRQSRLVL